MATERDDVVQGANDAESDRIERNNLPYVEYLQRREREVEPKRHRLPRPEKSVRAFDTEKSRRGFVHEHVRLACRFEQRHQAP